MRSDTVATMNFTDLLYSSTALFLDFDGTLVDIAEQPDQVEVPSALVPTLRSLNEYLGGAVAVISGRPIAQIDDFLKPLELAAAGVHGAERRSASGELELLSTQPLDLVEEAAHSLAARNAGLLVERKRGSVALHYRQAPQLEALCLTAMREAVQASPGVTLLQGKMVVEAKPSGATKGGAIEDFMRETPFAGRTPLFVGDDITDEVGFASVQRIGGLGVKVGAGASVAWQRIATPGQLRQELHDAVVARTGKTVA
jgi:trehalose 6-phosphate phosphatase